MAADVSWHILAAFSHIKRGWSVGADGECGGALRHFARFICIWISQLETFSDYFLRLPLRNMPNWKGREGEETWQGFV